MGHELGVALAHGRNFAVDALEQHLLGLAPGDAAGKGFCECGGFLIAGKGLVDLEQGRAFGVLGLARCARIGDDGHDLLAQFFGWHEQRNGVVVTLAHLAAIQPRQKRHVVVDLGLGQHQQILAVEVVEAGGHVARHFDMLDLVAAHGHFLRLEHQDVGGHQHRVHEKSRRHTFVRLLPRFGILVLRGLVGVRPVEQALAAHAGEQPGQFGDFGDVALAVERHAIGIESGSQPGGGDFQGAALDACGLVAFDERMVIGQEQVAGGVGALAGAHRGANGADVVAQVRRACGGDAGKITGDARHD